MIKCEVNRNKIPAITLEIDGKADEIANDLTNVVYSVYCSIHRQNADDAEYIRRFMIEAMCPEDDVWNGPEDIWDDLEDHEEQILAVVKMPGEKPRVEPLFENRLEAFQAAVGGYIETVTVAEDLVLIVNEEGLPFNCRVLGRDLVGTIVAVGVKGEEFCSLNGSALKTALELLGG